MPQTPGTNLGATVTATLTAHLKVDDLIMIASCTGGVPPATAGLFTPGAICSRTDGAGGGSSIYSNTGTTAAPVWGLMTVA